MKSFFLFLLFGGILGGLIGMYMFPPDTNSSEPASLVSAVISDNKPTATPTPTPTPTIAYYPPNHISIPNLNIDTSVESVTTDSEGKMATPQNPFNVGWYSLGTKPGEQGSMVIDGHYDLVTGAPAIFYNLAKLTNGDEITISDMQGTSYVYQVTDKQTYNFEDVPLDDLFNNKNSKRLILITCAGWWNHTTHNYSHRTVIYATLKQ